MLKILHIITGLGDGGAEAVLFRLCTYDIKNKHTVISIMNEGKYGTLLREAGINVFCLEMPKGRLNLKGLLRLFRLIRNLHPDVVQTWMYHANLIGGIVARLSGIRSICWGIHHSVLIRGVSPFSTILVAKVCALLSGIVPRVIICCSQEAIEVHKSMGYRADRMIYIPNGYDISKLRTDPEERENIRKEIGIEDDTPLLGMVARYDTLKDHENLLNALYILKKTGVNFKCVLAGTGMDDTNQKIKEQIRERALEREVLLLGRRNDIPALMNGLDLHILSSSSEAFPNVIAEAMACGTPCVATDVGDSAIIIGNTGWIVPPKEPGALADAITKAIDEHVTEPERWSRRSAGSRERIATNFEIGAVLKMYGECWRRTIL